MTENEIIIGVVIAAAFLLGWIWWPKKEEAKLDSVEPAPAPAEEPSAEATPQTDLSENDPMAGLDEFINSPNLGEVNLDDPDLYENIADLICEKKKLSRTSLPGIKTNIEDNMKLILLDVNYLPKEVVKRMSDHYEQVKPASFF